MKIEKIVKLGLQEYDKKNFDEALKLFKNAISTADINNRDKAILYRNIGLCHYSVRNWRAAEINFKKAVELGHKLAEWELCLTQLQSSNLDGMKLYSARYWGERDSFPDLPLKKIIQLEDIKKANNILVLNEQGLGDEILFSRSLKLLNGKKFDYQVYPEMLDLFKNSFQGNFFSQRTLSREFVLEHDYWVPNGDLFKLLTLCGDLEPLRIKSSIGKNNRIGICYSTNPKSQIKAKKSVDIDVLKPILKKFEADWVSLQYGVAIDFAENPQLDNFAHTKDVIDGLDLVITVDTVVANLAAAMSKPIILLINEYLDWRWINGFWSGDIQIVSLNELEDHLQKWFSSKDHLTD